MRRIVVGLGAAALLVPAAATAAKSQTGFAFGRDGGNIMPFTITVATNGSVKDSGSAPAHRTLVTMQQLATLNRVAFEVDFEHLRTVTACPKTLPDIAAEFIRVGDRTVRVHGRCVARFNRLWAALSRATRKP